MRRIRRERTIYLCKACRKMCRRRRIASSYSWSCAYSFSVGWRSQSSCKIGKRSVAMPSRYLRQTSAAGSGEVAKQARNRWGDAALALTPCPSPRLDRVADRLVIRRQNATRVAFSQSFVAGDSQVSAPSRPPRVHQRQQEAAEQHGDA